MSRLQAAQTSIHKQVSKAMLFFSGTNKTTVESKADLLEKVNENIFGDSHTQ